MGEASRVPALQVAGLSYRYGARTVLQDVSFSIAEGETVMLLGPNGAGKTTLFSLICALFAAKAGSVRIMGREVGSGAGALGPLGIVFQHSALDLDLSVGQNLRYFCALQGIDRAEADRRIAAELARMGLETREKDRVRALNGGHRRRVEIARASLHRPRLLLLDEPTVGLDIPSRRALVADLRARAGDTAMLWATHLADEAEGAGRVLILDRGRIVADGTPDSLIERTGAASLEAAFTALTAAPRERAA